MRAYTGELVVEEELQQVLEAALGAQHNVRLHIVVVTDESTWHSHRCIKGRVSARSRR